MNFLAKLRPPKFLRYIYYRLYIYALKTNNTTPKLSTSITLAFTHFIQILVLIVGIGAILGKDYWSLLFDGSNKLILIVILFVFLYLVKLFYEYHDKQEKYLLEFKDETVTQHRRGKFYVFLYLTLSIPVALIILGYLIVSVSPYYD